jgi:F-type H+-transporting ATPase subunit b
MSVSSRLFSQALRRNAVSLRNGSTEVETLISPKQMQGIAGTYLGKLEALAAPPASGPGVFDTAGEPYIPKMLGKWPQMPANFKEFPERDIVNYPHPNVNDYPSKVRLGAIPDSWFRFFYEKTGETGGYLFLAGTTVTLISTELVVNEVEIYSCYPYMIDLFFFHLLVGGKVAKFLDDKDDNIYDMYTTWQKQQLGGFNTTIGTEEHLQKCYSVVNDMLFVAKRENVQLQLEAEYRNRVSTIHDTVKRRLEFLAEYEATRRRFESDHMIEWIMKQVSGSLTPQMETATLKQCVSDLKALGNKG